MQPLLWAGMKLCRDAHALCPWGDATLSAIPRGFQRMGNSLGEKQFSVSLERDNAAHLA